MKSKGDKMTWKLYKKYSKEVSPRYQDTSIFGPSRVTFLAVGGITIVKRKAQEISRKTGKQVKVVDKGNFYAIYIKR